MDYARSVIVGTMRSWLGKTGSDEWHDNIVNLYNSFTPLPRGYKMKDTDAWGATCVSAAFLTAGYAGIFPIECNCQCMIGTASKMGIWVEADDYMPKPGDVIVYDWHDTGDGDNAGIPDQIAVVESITDGVIHAIEGDCDNEVKRRTIAVDGKYIRGFITPKYTTEVIDPDIPSGTRMKYSDANPPAQCFMRQSTWFDGALQNGRPVGILWHDTGAGNPTLKRYVQPDDDAPDRDYWLNKLGKNLYNNDWNHIYHEAGLNCWIGRFADGTVGTVQVGPWTTHAWGCGGGNKGSCNGYVCVNGNVSWVDPFWIQFEMCDDGYDDPNYFSVVYEEACQLTAYLCKKFGIDPKGTVVFNGVTVPTILCHADSCRLGLGSNHGDVYSWFNKYGYTMDNVRNDVENLLKSGSVPGPSPEPHEFKVGEVVNFTGTMHYVSADAASGYICKGGPATIVRIYELGTSKHPYSLIAVPGGGSTVYGWVDAEYVQALPSANAPEEPEPEPVEPPANVEPEPEPVKRVTASQNATAGPTKSLSGTYVAKAKLYIRDGAGAKYKALVVLPKGTTVANYGYYTLVGKTKWLYIQVTVDNVIYTGFSSSNSLKRKK